MLREALSSYKISLQQVSDGLLKQNGGKYILTDDKAPVELLGIRVIDRLINEEVSYYRGIYEKVGISYSEL